MLNKLKKRIKDKTVIACIGNELRTDDGVGPYIAKTLSDSTKYNVINCEDVPEHFTGEIKRHNPKTVIFIDAVQMDAEPGSASIIETKDLDVYRIFTAHKVPLKVLFNYIEKETGADVFLIGIQPENMQDGKTLTPKVKKSAEYLEDILRGIV